MMFSVGVGQMIYEDSINRSSEFQFLFKKTPIRQLESFFSCKNICIFGSRPDVLSVF
jgi:hypothetical protein